MSVSYTVQHFCFRQGIRLFDFHHCSQRYLEAMCSVPNPFPVFFPSAFRDIAQSPNYLTSCPIELIIGHLLFHSGSFLVYYFDSINLSQLQSTPDWEVFDREIRYPKF